MKKSRSKSKKFVPGIAIIGLGHLPSSFQLFFRINFPMMLFESLIVKQSYILSSFLSQGFLPLLILFKDKLLGVNIECHTSFTYCDTLLLVLLFELLSFQFVGSVLDSVGNLDGGGLELLWWGFGVLWGRWILRSLGGGDVQVYDVWSKGGFREFCGRLRGWVLVWFGVKRLLALDLVRRFGFICLRELLLRSWGLGLLAGLSLFDNFWFPILDILLLFRSHRGLFLRCQVIWLL